MSGIYFIVLSLSSVAIYTILACILKIFATINKKEQTEGVIIEEEKYRMMEFFLKYYIDGKEYLKHIPRREIDGLYSAGEMVDVSYNAKYPEKAILTVSKSSDISACILICIVVIGLVIATIHTILK